MSLQSDRNKIVIMGAAGRDFHNFNVVYRNDPGSEVVAFTAAQIPDIAGKRYPPALAGPFYPEGIPIVDEIELADLCREQHIEQVIFAYSDVSHSQVMHQASIALAGGADFTLLGPKRTQLQASVPVIACCAVRTGCGKSQVTQWLSKLLKSRGLKTAVIRHPMPYGDLEKQAVQRFTSMADLALADCTIEEREEYEPHLSLGNTVFAGIDYAKILAIAEQEADIILWDGGNNDFSFIRPDLLIVLTDPLRPGHETDHHPGETVLRMADIVLINKANSATDEAIECVFETVRQILPAVPIIKTFSKVTLDQPERVKGKRVIVVEDGPSITHGGMAYGAGFIAATQAQATEIIDPRAFASVQLTEVYLQYPHIGNVLPAIGYHPPQLKALQQTLNAANADLIVSATPCDLSTLIAINKPIVCARYEFIEDKNAEFSRHIETFLKNHL